ncbi:MAG TPA: DUF72 domain-containing protein [Thermodesulfobacteriota bacterium]
MPRPERIRVGTSGWHYPRGDDRWTGVFYPRGTKDELAYYAERFDTVEVNVTFYRQVPPETTEAWAARTPDRFDFSVKLYQKFTHPKMYEAATGRPASVARGDLDAFKRSMSPLAEAGKLGSVLAQFPASFKRTPESERMLDGLLTALDGFPVTVELRHRSWSDAEEATEELLLRHRAGWAQIDEPKFATSVRQPMAVRGGIGYFRLHGRNAEAWWKKDAGSERYHYLYSDDELDSFVDAILGASDRAERVYVYFNNHFRGASVANALMMKPKLGQPLGAAYEPTLVEHYPVLEGRVPVAGPKGQGRLL